MIPGLIIEITLLRDGLAVMFEDCVDIPVVVSQEVK